MTVGGEVKLLIVEDDEVDLIGLRRALKRLRVTNPIHVAKDGVDALEKLRGQNGQAKLRQPYIVLLDLNMPRMGGLELLEEMRGDDALKGAVVFAMTTSSDEADILAAYSKNVAGYFIKSSTAKNIEEIVGLLKNYWQVARLPAS